jgi:hypothetical protein
MLFVVLVVYVPSFPGIPLGLVLVNCALMTVVEDTPVEINPPPAPELNAAAHPITPEFIAVTVIVVPENDA